MAKALKIGAAVIGGVALLATGVGAVALGGLAGTLTVAGVSTSTLLLTSSALALGASLLQKTPQVPSSQTDRLNASVNPQAYRTTVLGSTAMATDIRYIEWFGTNQERCGWIVAHASHAIDGLDEIWLDDELAWTAAGGVQGKFRNYFWVRRVVTEGTAANAFSFGSGRWNGSRRLTGCAYSFLEFKVTGNGKKAESPFTGGIPSRLTVIGRGAKLYDPRRDSTVPGGSGPMRADDQSTWRYRTDDGAVIGENVALQVLRVLLGWRINGKLAIGSGVPARRLNLASFALAANQCDELVNRSAGGHEARYCAAGVISEGDDPKTTLNLLCASCCGRFRDSGGKLSFVIMHNDLAAAATDPGLGDDDLVGPFTWDPDPSLEATPNIVRGKYVDATSASLYQLVPYPDVTLPSMDGIDRVLSLDFGAVESASQVQRIAKQTLQRKQYQRRFSGPFDIVAWRYNVGDVLPLTLATLGFRRKLFRVVETDPGKNPCQMVLEEENLAIYAWDADDAAPVRAADPLVYEKGNNPLIQAIDEAGRTAEWPSILDPAGNKPEDGATVGSTVGVNLTLPSGYILTEAELLNTALDLRPDGRLIAKIGGAERVLGVLKLPDMGAASDQARRQLETDLASMAAALAQLATGEQIVRQYLADAGLYTDPASGKAKLFAIEQRAEQISKLSVDLNAALGEIGLKANVSYVNEAILKAQLSGNADLGGLLVRLTSAETIISGLQASIIQKADATIVTGLQGTVTAVQQSIDAINAELSLKASRTTVDTMGQRLNVVEQEFRAFDGASITQSAMVTRRVPADADAAGANAILDMLNGHTGLSMTTVAIASAKSDLRALVDSNTSAIAAQGFQLGVQIGGLTGLVASEQSARIAGDQASASALAAYRAVNDQAVATVQGAITTQSDRMTSLAGRFDTLTAKIGDFGSVTVAQSFSALVDRTGKLEGQITFSIDTNGNVSGMRLLGSGSGVGTLAVFNMDLSMGTGRIIFNSGNFMKVMGVGFGVARDLIEWFGPTMPIEQCSRSNAISYESTNGDAHHGGSLSAGTLRNSASSSILGSAVTAEVGPFGSNGKPVRYVASWACRSEHTRTYPPTAEGRQAFDQDVAAHRGTGDGYVYFGTITAQVQASTVTLSRSFDGATWTQIDQRTFTTQTLTMSGVAPTPGDAPGSATFTTTIGGGFTVNDQVQSAGNRWLRLVLARGFNPGVDGVSQRLTIVATEE